MAAPLEGTLTCCLRLGQFMGTGQPQEPQSSRPGEWRGEFGLELAEGDWNRNAWQSRGVAYDAGSPSCLDLSSGEGPCSQPLGGPCQHPMRRHPVPWSELSFSKV